MGVLPRNLLRRTATSPVGEGALTVLGSAVGFGTIALLAFQVVHQQSELVAIWPPNGFIVALFVLLPARLRPWVLLGVLPGELISDTLHGYPLLATVGFSVTDLVESGIAGVLLLRLAGRRPRGDRQRDFYALVAAASVAPFAGGLLGAAISSAEWQSPFFTSFLLWWLGDMLGILLVVSLAMPLSRPTWRMPSLRTHGVGIEIALVVGVTLAVFGLTTLPIMFAVLAPLTLLAVRHGLGATVVATIGFAFTATLMTGRGYGPFVGFESDTRRVVVLQSFIAITAFVILLISATMSERRNAETALLDLATHDPLTGLANRRLFVQHLERAAARTGRSAESSAIIYFDLDGFKDINDRLGHAVGDQILVEVGRRLTLGMRDGDLAARLGGDEFVGLLEPVDNLEAAALTARRVAELIEEPFRQGSVVVPLRVSVGAVLVTPDVELDLRQVDDAMYRDKQTHAHRRNLAQPGLRRTRAKLPVA